MTAFSKKVYLVLSKSRSCREEVLSFRKICQQEGEKNSFQSPKKGNREHNGADEKRHDFGVVSRGEREIVERLFRENHHDDDDDMGV